jgi:hypothetical protein
MKQFLRRTETRSRFFLLITFGLSTLGFAGWLAAQGQGFSDLTVHEWGTFTAIAGKDGEAVEWTPFTGSTDLPGFVEHLRSANFKLGLRGTIRMETPVMYFYSPHEVTVSVRVAFARGIITEWYPHAARVDPGGMIPNTSLGTTHTSGTITWDDVSVSPDLAGEFPQEDQASRYYAARETASSPLRVNTPEGAQQEKFLFYRGVSSAPLPLSARVNPDGSLFIKSPGQEEIPALILFERRGEKTSYRSAGVLTDEMVLNPPELDSTVDTLCAELEGILVERGLYPDEAHAMVATWRDSWFEEGSRLIYIVPASFIDHVLPLAIDPAPAQIVRVFVGRLELVTPATARAVEAALASHDEATLNKYGRFLDAILQTVRENRPELAQENRPSQ